MSGLRTIALGVLAMAGRAELDEIRLALFQRLVGALRGR